MVNVSGMKVAKQICNNWHTFFRLNAPANISSARETSHHPALMRNCFLRRLSSKNFAWSILEYFVPNIQNTNQGKMRRSDD